MAVASTVVVNITANTAKFVNGLKKAQKQGKGFSSLLSKGFKAATVATTGLGIALTALTAKSLKTIDQQTKMAQRLGTTQRALAGLTLAAEQTGTTQQNLQLAMQRSTRRIAEAAQGTGEAVKALKELGLSAKQLAALAPDKQFLKIAGAMNEVTSQSDRIRLGFKLFDSEGVGLINTLALGEEGMQGFINKAQELGVAMTDKQTLGISKANNAINIMKTSFAGLGNQIAARVSPAIVTVAEKISSMTSFVTNAIPAWSAWAAKIFGVRRELQNLSLTDVNEELRVQDKRVEAAQARLIDQRNSFEDANRAGSLIAEGTDIDTLPIIIRLTEEYNKENKRWNDLIKERLRLRKEGEVADPGAAPGLEGGGIDPVAATGFQKEFDAAVKATAKPLEALQAKLATIRSTLESNPLWTPELAARQANAAVDAYLSQLERLDSTDPLEGFQTKLAAIKETLKNNPFLTPEDAGRQSEIAVDAYLDQLDKLDKLDPLVVFQAKLAAIRTQLETNPIWSPEVASRQASEAVDAYLEQIGTINDANAAIIDKQKADFDAAARAVATPSEELQAAMNDIRVSLASNPFWTPEVAGRQAQEAVDAYLEEMKRLELESNNVMLNMSEFQRRSFSNMQDILSTFLFDPWEDGLDGMFKSFVDMLRKMVAQIVATKILEYLFGVLGGFGGGNVASAATASIPKIGPPGAIGGLRTGGQSLLVGERGPEMFTPGASGSIRPLGSVTVEQNNSFGGGGGITAATLVPILEENNKKVKADILDAFDRGAFA